MISVSLMAESQKTLNVCVTGAAGQIGYAFLPLLLTGQVFGPRTKINLRLLDIPQSEEILKGVILELEDGAYPLLGDLTSGSNPNEMFKDLDVGVFIGGFPRKPGMERKDLLNINAKIFKEQGTALNDHAKDTCHCVVVANPANTNCLLLQTFAKKIPKENFTALTRLDHNRAKFQIAAKAGAHVTNVKDVFIWGNHSTTQYPDVNHGTVNGKAVREVITDEKYLNEDFIARVQKRGGEVLAVRKGSSVFSAANAVKDHLHDWYLGNESQLVSKAVITTGAHYGVPAGLCYSFPVRCKGNWVLEIVDGLKIDEFSQGKLDATTKELLEEREDASDFFN